MAFLSETLKASAHSKLNVRLVIEGRRDDGFHLLSMLNVRTGLCDDVSISPTNDDKNHLEVSDPSNSTPVDFDTNLVGRAARVFFEEFKIQQYVHIHLTKRVPSGAGLGGGSSDAATVLNLLGGAYQKANHVHSEEMKDRLLTLAAKLGSDVPYFLQGGLTFVSGIGEKLMPLTSTFLAGWPCLIVMPSEILATPQVYAKYRQLHPNAPYAPDQKMREITLRQAKNQDLKVNELLTLIQNDLEPASLSLCPPLAEGLSLARSQSNVMAGMTGSGSAFFVLPTQKEKTEYLDHASTLLAEKYKVFATFIVP